MNDGSLGLQQRLSLAEAYYASGDFAERQGSCRSVDWFFGATMVTWDLSCDPTIDAGARDARGRIESLYQSSLLRLLRSSQRFGRFDPASGLAVELPQGKLRVPVVVHSNVWCTADLGHFAPVGEYDDPGLTHRYRTVGRGVPVVARRREGRGTPMVPDGQPFALTALLQVSADRPAGVLESPGGAVDLPALGCTPILEFYDPFLTHNADVGGCPVPLATDISAPLAYAHHFATFSPVRDFLQPDDTVRLAALGPHERGKIPIIFVHGLLSEPLTYLDMANEIRGDAVLSQRYEIWGFRYPTGGAVLEAAAGLREQLARAVADFPGCDPALSQMVIVGHSMGGLVSKLQVTDSGTVLWDRLATRPFTELRASDEVRMKLARAVFFQPSPAITRIVYIATPHEGSPWADRLVGRAASHCVRLPPENVAGMQQVVVDNPGLLQPTAPKRPPTSIDLLEPSSTVLQGFRDLRYSPCVKVHSIVGTGRTMVHGGPADGVVPVASAREPASISEVEVPATHSEILRDQRTICELKRILVEHLRTVARSAPEGLERETIVPGPATPEAAAPGNTARVRGGAAR
ncbi:MAG: hypothetical protein JNG90_08060 [Planctomycetaceae bacterium]|nr:hypothetical protein [Planctomycetaceae bacterium]